MSITAERVYGGYLSRRDYRRPMIEWAMARLTAGSGCPSTILLAGADFEPDDEVIRLFRRAAGEEWIFLPDAEEEPRWRERWLCSEIVTGQMAPQPGVSELYKIWVDSGFQPEFEGWLLLSESILLLEEGCDGLEPFHEMKWEEIDATIVREARIRLQVQVQ